MIPAPLAALASADTTKGPLKRKKLMFESVAHLKRAIPYIQLYKGKTFVVKIGGRILQRQEILDEVAADITMLHQVGIQIAVVHGGGPQASELCTKLGIEPQIIAGRRITDEKVLEVTKMVYAGKLNVDLLNALQRHGSSAVGLSGVDGNLLLAHRRDKKKVQAAPHTEAVEVDFGFVGEIERVNIPFLEYFLHGGLIPVISSLATDGRGTVFNVNADTVAEQIAQALRADKLLILTDTDGVLADPQLPSSLISYTDIDEITRLCEEGQISGGMLPKVEACLRALKGGVRRTHILNGTRNGALLVEIFTNAGCGTMIVDHLEHQSYLQMELERQQPSPKT